MYNLKPVAIHAEGKGPVFPKSFSRVVFRIAGENQLRYFDSREATSKSGITFVNAESAEQEAQRYCEMFIDLRCRAFVELNGYNPETKEYKACKIISSEVDHFYCVHPEVTLKGK